MELKYLIEELEDAAILITGGRGKGKTALGYYILELAHNQGRKTAIFNFPKQKRNILPGYMETLYDINKLPDDTVILIDEAAFNFNSRESMKKNNKLIGKLIGLCRQKAQVLVFISHNSRKLDPGIITDLDIVLLKKPSLLHIMMERIEFRALTQKADENLKNKGKEFTYCVSEDYRGLLINPLPGFWTDDLSCAFKGINITEEEQEPYEDIPDENITHGQLNLKCTCCNKDNTFEYPEKCKHCGEFMSPKPIFNKLRDKEINFSIV
jgi:hypothetical protein